jgi:hypothetical protein
MKRGLLFFLRSLLVLVGFFSFWNFGFGQQFQVEPFNPGNGVKNNPHDHSEKCAHSVLEAKLEKELGYFGSKEFLEDWMQQKIQERRLNPTLQIRQLQEPRLIPVVVHVIHSGGPVGTGQNIPDEQIFNQIRILNEDYRRKNPDAVNTPQEFLPVAADSNIEFVLAKQDPNGLPTNGIVRIQGPKSSYSANDATLIGSISQWNPNEYLNVWVVSLSNNVIGYASYPVSNLPGLNFSPVPALEDGVTIDYRFFGVGGSAVGNFSGRTATHEIGHYLGLRHIWGDGGCGVDDFVADTPLQGSPNYNCVTSRITCETSDMIQNYMDYTNDLCMNLFTFGQVERFNVVLANSPRRVTLVNNRATIDPNLLDRDLAINRVIRPVDAVCEPTVSPLIEVVNGGSTRVTSTRIEVRLNGLLKESRVFNLNLPTGSSIELSFNSLDLVGGANKIEFKIVEVNGQSDQNQTNDIRSTNTYVQGEIDLPYVYSPAPFPNDWVISNPDGSFTWQSMQTPISGQTQNLIYIRNYEYESPGALDYLISPQIDLAKYPNAQLTFDLAHAPYNQAGYQDRLYFVISGECGEEIKLENIAYEKSGTRLETSPPTLDEFIPTSENQFRKEVINLNGFKNLGKIKIAIISENSFGNNIYLKNIHISPEEVFKYELKIDEIVSPTPITDGGQESEIIRVINTGNLPVSRFLLSRSLNGGSTQTLLSSGGTVSPGESINLTLPNGTSAGKSRLIYQVTEPNFDQNASTYPEFRWTSLENSNETQAPWRQNFNLNAFLEPWVSINPENDLAAWNVSSISNGSGPNNIARIENPQAGNSYWMGSPIFDLSISRQASVFFDLAVGQINPQTKFSVLASSNGGQTYTEVWTASGSELSTVTVGGANPNSPLDYSRKYVNLTEFAGPGKTETRLAFVLKTAGTQDSPIYLDNIELFLNANPEPVIPGSGNVVLYPNPAYQFFNLAFNLPQFEEVNIRIISANGSIVQDLVYPNTLNQTYTFTTDMFSPGIYVIQLFSNSITETKRLVVN